MRDKLREMAGLGHQLVFFTNRSAAQKGKIIGVDQKIDNIIAALGPQPDLRLAALQKGATATADGDVAFFHVASNHRQLSAQSFFVGDAAGRPVSTAQKDFSRSDLKFAPNLGGNFSCEQFS